MIRAVTFNLSFCGYKHEDPGVVIKHENTEYGQQE